MRARPDVARGDDAHEASAADWARSVTIAPIAAREIGRACWHVPGVERFTSSRERCRHDQAVEDRRCQAGPVPPAR